MVAARREVAPTPVSYPAGVVARIQVVEDDDVIGLDLVRVLARRSPVSMLRTT